MSSEWMTAEECLDAGLVWRLCTPESLLPEAMAAAAVLAAKPLASLIECKRVMTAASREPIAAARARENEAFRRLMGTPANVEALTAFAERREPDFVAIDAQHPVDLTEHR
jgi:enoyl-CoA hydratase/carnithine racemase